MSNLFKKIFFGYMVLAMVVLGLGGFIHPAQATTYYTYDQVIAKVNAGQLANIQQAGSAGIYNVYKNADGTFGKLPIDSGYIYKAWFADDYSDRLIMTATEFKKIAVGIGVFALKARPGSLIAFYDANSTVDNNVYAVDSNYQLHLVSDAVGAALYGSNWKTKSDTMGGIQHVRYQNAASYGNGAPLTTMLPDGTLVSNGGNYYVISGTTLRQVTTSGLSGNSYDTARAVALASTSSYTMGTQVTGLEAGLWNFAATAPVVNQGATGGLTVTMASDNPTANNVPVGTSEIVPVLRLNFAASSANAVTVTGLNVHRTGLSADSDISNVYLLDGSHVIATNLGINQGVVNFSNGAGLFTVPAGTTKEITVAASLATAGITYGFSVDSASAVMAPNTTIGGSFPIPGQIFTGSSVSNLGGVQITNASSGTTAPGLSISAGQTNFTVGQFSILAQNQPEQIRSLTFTMTGSVANSDVTNFKLMNGGTQLGSTLTGFGANNTITFDLSSNPLSLTSGQTAQLYLYADVIGGVNRYFQFSVQHNYDVIAQDMMFNIGVLPTLNTGSYPTNMSYVSVSAGTLTLTRNATSPTQSVLPGGTNQIIAKFDLKTAGEAVRVTALNIDLTGSTVSPTTYVSNLKVVDDQGTQIGTTVTSVSTLTTPGAYTNLNYVIPINTTRTLMVYADLNASATGNLIASLTGVTGQGFTSLAAVGPFSQSGNTLVANSTLLSAAQNTALSSVNTVSGAPTVQVASFSLTAGSVSPVTVTNLAFHTPAAAVNATTSASWQNLKVMVGSTQIGQTYGTLVDNSGYNFTAATPIQIAAGNTVIVDVYADAKTSGTFTASPVIKLDQYGVSATAVQTNQAITNIPANAVNGQNVTVNGSGTLTYNLYNTPVGSQVAMNLTGSSAVKLATYQLIGSASEDITVTDIYVSSTASNLAAFKNFTVKINGIAPAAAGATSLDANGLIHWSGVNATVTRNNNATLDIYAETNSWGVLNSSGATIKVTVYKVDYQGASSGNATNATNHTPGNTFTLYRTTLTPATATGVALNSIGATDLAVVGAFTFTAGSADAAYLATTTMALTFSGATTSTATVLLHLYDADTNQQIASSTVTTNTGSNSNTFTLNQGNAATGGYNGAAGISVPQNGSKTIIVKADLSTYPFTRTTAGSAASLQIGLSQFGWSDGSAANVTINANPTINLPVYGGVATF